MNIAVVIGVSEYKSVPRLPACSADVAQMHRLLLATKKYADIQCITTSTDAAPLKGSPQELF